MDSSSDSPNTIIIGAGQAGLAAAYYLQQAGVAFLMLDAAAAIGDNWASRYDSLQLFSPAWASGLPGLPWPGRPLRYPTKDEAAAYLRTYVQHFNLPVALGQRVVCVQAQPGGGYRVATAAGHHYHCQRVLVCTGPYSQPAVPAMAQNLAPTVPQLHSRDYQRPQQLPPHGAVAVVGSGNSALQIAHDIALTKRPVFLAFDEATPAMPNNTFMWALLRGLGVMQVSARSRLGAYMRGRPEPVVLADMQAARQLPNITWLGRAVAAEGTQLRGQLASTPALAAVVWATGYRPNYSWLEVPVLDAQGYPQHTRGLTASSGLAFLGLPWLNSRASALMGGVGSDARFVVRQLLAAAPLR